MQNELLYSDKEICRQYMEAKNKTAQVNILAQINGTNTYRIISILKRNGCYVPCKRKNDSVVRYATLSEDELTRLYVSHVEKIKNICKALEIKSAGGN